MITRKSNFCNFFPAIVITDGNSQEPIRTREAALKLRDYGVGVFAIGVGPELAISQKELVSIGGEASHVFRVQSYDKLKNIESSVLNAACGEYSDLKKC
jgi:hypothetical protein